MRAALFSGKLLIVVLAMTGTVACSGKVTGDGSGATAVGGGNAGASGQSSAASGGMTAIGNSASESSGGNTGVGGQSSAAGGGTFAMGGSSLVSSGGNASTGGQSSAASGGTFAIGGSTSVSSGGMAGSGGTGGSSTVGCVTAPALSSIAQGSSCPTRLSALGASATSVAFWVADSMATGTGSTLLLTPNQDLVANNHTYRLTGAGSLFGTGLVDGVSLVASGYIEIEVDSVAAKIRFDIAGCASPLGSGTALGEYSYSARVSRQVAGCASCTPDTVLRNFTVTETNAQGSTSYTFENGSAPAGCSIGVDLIRFTLG